MMLPSRDNDLNQPKKKTKTCDLYDAGRKLNDILEQESPPLFCLHIWLLLFMSSWVTTLIYAKAGHLSIIGLWFSTRTFIFITGGGMCMWRQRYPKSTGKAESKAVRQFNMRGYGDQEDDALLSCACPNRESTLQTTARGLPLLTLPAFVRLTQTSPLKSVSTFYVSPTRIRRFLSHNRGVGTSVLPELSGFILSLYSFGSLNCFTFLLIQRPPYPPITPTN